MGPVVIPSLPALLGWGRMACVPLQPLLNYVMIKLLGPEHARKALAHHILRIRRQILGNHVCVELLRLMLAPRDDPVKIVKRRFEPELGISKPQAEDYRQASIDHEPVMSSRFGADTPGIHSILAAVHHVVVDAVLHVWTCILQPEECSVIGFVLGGGRFRMDLTMEPAVTGQ